MNGHYEHSTTNLIDKPVVVCAHSIMFSVTHTLPCAFSHSHVLIHTHVLTHSLLQVLSHAHAPAAKTQLLQPQTGENTS